MKKDDLLNRLSVVAGTGLDPSADGPPAGGYEPNDLIEEEFVF